jgi:hypothetical protein
MKFGKDFPSAFAALRRDKSVPPCGCAPSAVIRFRRDKSAFGVAAFGRKPPFEFLSQFAALCRDAATPGFRRDQSARFPCGIQIADLSTEIFHVQAVAFDDAFQRPDRNGFASVHGHNHLPAIFVTPFLMAAGLRHQFKAVPA